MSHQKQHKPERLKKYNIPSPAEQRAAIMAELKQQKPDPLIALAKKCGVDCSAKEREKYKQQEYAAIMNFDKFALDNA